MDFAFVLFFYCRYQGYYLLITTFWDRFLALMGVIGAIAASIVLRLFQNCCMSEREVKRRLEAPDVMEMQDLLDSRQYEGRIYLPAGC
jgi:hypothetical protein